MSVIVGRSRIATKYGIVAASQPLAARAGVQILERGGNAVDAAIATNAVMGLVEPQSNGIGGDLFAIVYDAEDRQRSTGSTPAAGRRRADAGAPRRRRATTAMPQGGIHTVTVPGAVAGWDGAARAASARCRSPICSRRRFSTPTTGFPVTDVIAAHWAALADKLAGEPNAAATYLPDGRAPRGRRDLQEPGPRARRCASSPSTAAPASTRARPPTPSSRSRASSGGTMTAADLREFEPEWVEPISTTYRGWTVYELPPNTQGIAALMMLNLMEQFPLARVRLPQRARAARDDRGEEARLRRHAALRRRPALRGAAGAGAARQGARGASARSSSIRRRAAATCEPSIVRRPHDRRRAATRSTCRSSTGTATSCR